MAQLYNSDQSIDLLFKSGTSATRQQCDDFVSSMYEAPTEPAVIQGSSSYTLMAGEDGSEVIQFRDQDSAINKEVMVHLQQIIPGYVARVDHLEAVGLNRPLQLYRMARIPGIPYSVAKDCSLPQREEVKTRQRATIEDLAFYFAQTWIYIEEYEPILPWQRAAIAAEYGIKLGRLIESLPSRFTEALRSLEADLADIFSKRAFVITHARLDERKIIIDPQTGRINGITGWAGAQFLPFGLEHGALDNVLGFMDSSGGWHDFDNHRELRELFWVTFYEYVDTMSRADVDAAARARQLGLFMRYGFITEGNTARVAGPSDTLNMAYLDTFCLSRAH